MAPQVCPVEPGHHPPLPQPNRTTPPDAPPPPVDAWHLTVLALKAMWTGAVRLLVLLVAGGWLGEGRGQGGAPGAKRGRTTLMPVLPRPMMAGREGEERPGRIAPPPSAPTRPRPGGTHAVVRVCAPGWVAPAAGRLARHRGGRRAGLERCARLCSTRVGATRMGCLGSRSGWSPKFSVKAVSRSGGLDASTSGGAAVVSAAAPAPFFPRPFGGDR